MANLVSVRLNRGDSSSWGFRLQGGLDFGTPLVIQKVIGGSPAERAGLIAGDTVIKINNVDVYNLRHKDAQDVILRAGPAFEIAIQRGGSTWKPAVSPVGTLSTPRPASSINSVSPVTHTSLAAHKQTSIDSIGTSHNLAAKPFAQLNGGPRLVNKQYNSPLPLYSDRSIAETLSAQSEVLSNGVLGVNFKKNEKSYDASNSEVFRMVQEADQDPRPYEPVTGSDFYATHSHAVGGCSGGHHSTLSCDQTQSSTLQDTDLSQSESDQKSSNANNQPITKCTDCERVIVGVFVRIKDKNLHVECFKCSTCGSSLKNVGYYNLNNKLYCDVHAKLAARNNPPGPNLVPVTVPPGGRIPAGTISAALASHPLPTAAPLSPKPNYSAAPYQPSACYSSPRPFSSVSGPLSPSNNLPKLSPIPAAPLPGRSAVKSSVPFRENSSVHNIVWPPIHSDPELPTASPLYFPPPSQVQLTHKLLQKNSEKAIYSITDNSSCSEIQEMEYITQNKERNMSVCSTEVSSITARSTTECSETISETIGTQILVDKIIQSRPKSPTPCKVLSEINTPLPPKPEIAKPGDVNVTFTISEAELKRGAYKNTESAICETNTLQESNNICQLQEIKSTQSQQSYDKQTIENTKIENTVPHKWESAMVTALTTASNKPYSQISTNITSTEQRDSISSDTFSKIPTKKSTSALASALAVAPAEPFTPHTMSLNKPVPLPEDTVPYFPPEHNFIMEHKSETDVEDDKRKVAPPKKTWGSKMKKKERTEDELFKDLPIPPPERISMLAALTTAPDRPFSPLTVEMSSYQTTEDTEITEVEKEKINVNQTIKTSEELKSKIKNESQLQTAQVTKNKFNKECVPYFATVTTSHSVATQEKSAIIDNKSRSLKTEEKAVVSDQKSSATKSSTELSTKNVHSTEKISNVSTGLPPLIQLVRSTFETGTDKVQMEMSCQFLGNADTQIIEKSTSKTDTSLQQSQEKSVKQSKLIQQKTREESKKQSNIDSKKSSKLTSCAKKAFTASNPSFTQITEDITESDLINKATAHLQYEVQDQQQIQIAQHQKSKTESSRDAIKKAVTVIKPEHTNLNVPSISFQPVNEYLTRDTTFSARPKSITPSMINKLPPLIPYYQSSLVAQQCTAPEINVFDPTSPSISRSPSPFIGSSTSPFPSPVPRAPSPAPGPPPNPLFSSKSLQDLKLESKVQEARTHVQSYIPLHQDKLKTRNHSKPIVNASCGISQESVDACKSIQDNSKSVSVKSCSQEQQIHQEANLKTKCVESINENNVQISRSQQVNEEYERTQKSKVIQIEKYATKTSDIQIQETATENQFGSSLHVTNPQRLKFSTSGSTSSATSIQCPQTSCLNNSCPKTALPSIIPKLSKTSCEKTNIAPIVCASTNVNVIKPFVPQPNTGAGGGRQSGAIPVAPRRGRGILNLAATPGSRVPLCAQCHSNIRGPFITALGKIWCPDHFVCATPSCRRPLQDLGFVEEQGQLYCEYCFEQYIAPPCAKCNSKIKGDCLKAIGKNFHPECFNCVYCGKLFGNSPFFLEDSQPYCEADWNELFTTKCFACGFPVEAGDRWVEALNNNYHSQCFNCTMCKKNLEGQSFVAKGGRPFCKNHAR